MIDSVSPQEMADMFGMNVMAVYKALNRGALKGEVISRTWSIPLTEAKRYYEGRWQTRKVQIKNL
jgi:hypothetical protein